jgi:hypothetical protein
MFSFGTCAPGKIPKAIGTAVADVNRGDAAYLKKRLNRELAFLPFLSAAGTPLSTP